ncbi:MAG: SET domain-containing protein-lysine N-methyltransferase [Candidatus Aenigmarchaeota archaeon]|nr:SET domain-containing protein-lysine N-methyltransferase [Candidatus Aenigmarchaeota archaeon]
MQKIIQLKCSKNIGSVEVKKSSIHNKGLFARDDMQKGAFIIEYSGDKISKEEGSRRESESLNQNGTTYIFELDDICDIDGSSEINIAKYANHSCKPNCKISIRQQVVNGNKIKHIWLQSLSDIKKGEEITYNYGFSSEEKLWKCNCSSSGCVGFMVARDEWKKLKSRLKRSSI